MSRIVGLKNQLAAPNVGGCEIERDEGLDNSHVPFVGYCSRRRTHTLEFSLSCHTNAHPEVSVTFCIVRISSEIRRRFEDGKGRDNTSRIKI